MWEVRMMLADAKERLSKARKHEALTKEEMVWLSAEEALERLVSNIVDENGGDDHALRTMNVCWVHSPVGIGDFRRPGYCD